MTKKRFLLALALMLTAVGGAWAQGNTTPVNWNAATKTGSLTTPAGNVTLTVNYYGQYRLDSIPQGWQVKVNGSLMGSDTLKTYTEGNPQMRYIAAINETDSVELIPPASLKDVIKSVTLVEPAPAVQTLTIGHPYGNTTITYLPGETWRQAIQNHAENANVDWDVWGTPEKVWLGEMKLYSMTGDVWSLVDPDTAISSSTQYKLDW